MGLRLATAACCAALLGLAAGAAIATPALAQGKLVALGDSYSAGEGAPPFEPGTAIRGNTCHRSRAAWPFLVARSAGLAATSIACSGARTFHVTSSSQRRPEPERRISQLSRLRELDADLVTISIGGNDIGFAEVLTRCVLLRDCRDSYRDDDGDVLDRRIATLGGRLPAIYRRILATAPGARLVVVGYPRIFTPRPGENCAAFLQIRPAEAAYMNARAANLNATIRAAARRAKVAFVDVSDSVAGHEISCRPSPWINRLTFIHDGIVSPYSFHPTRRGYQAIAATVQARLRALGVIPLR